jgi:hypothetical protein
VAAGQRPGPLRTPQMLIHLSRFIMVSIFWAFPPEETVPPLDDIDDPWLRGSTFVRQLANLGRC